MATGAINSALYVSGPGIMWVGEMAAADPALDTTVVTASMYPTTPPTGFLPVGSTADGFEFSDEISTEEMEAAESYQPVRIITVGRASGMSFTLQEWSKSNLIYALNTATSGAVTTGTTGTTATVITPAGVGAEVRRKWLWQSEDNTVRLLAYQAVQAGSLAARATKGATPAGLDFNLRFELPVAGVAYRIGLAGVARNV